MWTKFIFCFAVRTMYKWISSNIKIIIKVDLVCTYFVWALALFNLDHHLCFCHSFLFWLFYWASWGGCENQKRLNKSWTKFFKVLKVKKKSCNNFVLAILLRNVGRLWNRTDLHRIVALTKPTLFCLDMWNISNEKI